MNQSNAYAFARMAAQGDLRPIHSGLRKLHRGQWVVCRSEFGLELAEILSETQDHSELDLGPDPLNPSSALWVRDANSQDLWLWEKLLSVNQDAIPACQEFLLEHQCDDTLLEIATSIDGKSVAFQFLGDPSEQTNRRLDDLSEIYQAFVKKSEIYQQIEQGCGPGCGTSQGCGSSSEGKSSCSSCAVAKRCKKP